MATIAIGVDPASGNYICKVPVNSLAEDGVPPEQGDTVQYSVSGTVQSISGPTATVKIDSINGEPVSEEAAESPEEETGEEQGEGAGGPSPSGGGAGSTPVAASGPGMASGLDRIPGTPIGLNPTRRKNMANVAAMGQRLRKGAKGKPFPPF